MRTSLERYLIAYSAALPFLPEFAAIVARIREEHEIEPPVALDGLRENLRNHPPHGILPQVLQALKDLTWPEDLSWMNHLLKPGLASLPAQEDPTREDPFIQLLLAFADTSLPGTLLKMFAHTPIVEGQELTSSCPTFAATGAKLVGRMSGRG